MSSTAEEPVTGPLISQETHEARRTSFGAGAADYDRVRPEWPAATLTWLLGDPTRALDVLDLGAGTGKGTRTLADLGHRVTAVEPSEGMLAVLRDGLGERDVRPVLGDAENLPLDDDSIDGAVCLQAWHWVDAERGGPQVARVLRPGGWFGLAWHQLDTSQDWTRELYAACRRPEAASTGESSGSLILTGVPGFGGFEHRQTTYDMVLSPDDLVTQVASWSHIAIHPEREQILADVRVLGERRADGGLLTLPHVTDCFRGQVEG